MKMRLVANVNRDVSLVKVIKYAESADFVDTAQMELNALHQHLFLIVRNMKRLTTGARNVRMDCMLTTTINVKNVVQVKKYVVMIVSCVY